MVTTKSGLLPSAKQQLDCGRGLRLCSAPGNASHNASLRIWQRRSPRAGVALLLCLFVLAIVSVWVVNILDSVTVYQAALRNTVEYEQALYLANAGVHHAVAEMELDISWRGVATAGGYPTTGSYQATAVNGVAPGTVEITSAGVSGEAVRRLQAIVQVN
jgi:hypothetical protein